MTELNKQKMPEKREVKIPAAVFVEVRVLVAYDP